MAQNVSGEYTGITMLVPTEDALDVMEEVITLQADLRARDKDIIVEVVRNAKPNPKRRESDLIPSDAGAEEASVQARPVGTVRTARGQRKAATTTISTVGRNSVIYRVIDPKVKVTPRNQEVRMYMLQHGPRTARQLMDQMNLGRKVIESALHGLRTEGAVESVEDKGQAVTQRKFSKREIAAGAQS